MIDFAMLPPEVNSGRMYTGPGAGPMLAAAASWDALAAELDSTASGYSSVLSGLTAQAWSGPVSMTMTAAVTPYVMWLHATAAQADRTAAQAKAAAAAYEAAFAMTVPPPVIAANRALLMALIATNFFGQNTPAIAATEAHYLEMWVQDATAMYGYAGASSTASTLTPFSEPPRTTNPGGQGAQAAAVAQAAGIAAGAHVHNLAQITSALPTALQQLVSPLGSPGTYTPSSLWNTFSTGASYLPLPDNLASALVTQNFGLFMGTYTVLANGAGWGRELLLDAGIEGYLNLVPVGPFHALEGLGATASAGLGKAASIGALSVPPSWASAVPAAQPVAITLAAVSVEAAPGLGIGMPPGFTFQQALMGTVTGGRAVSEVSDHKKSDKDKKQDKDKDKKDNERPAAELVSNLGWLASSAAYHARRRSG